MEISVEIGPCSSGRLAAFSAPPLRTRRSVCGGALWLVGGAAVCAALLVGWLTAGRREPEFRRLGAQLRDDEL